MMPVLLDAAELLLESLGQNTEKNVVIESLQDTANLWEMYLYNRGVIGEDSNGLTPDDIAQMAMLAMVSKLGVKPGDYDALVGICYYAAVIERMHKND